MNYFLDLVILLVLHLSGKKADPNFFCHKVSSFKSTSRRLQSCWLLILLNRIQSSATNPVFYWIQSGRSLVNSKISNGPSTVPLGTPLKTGILSEVAPSTSTYLVISFRKAESIFGLLFLCRNALILPSVVYGARDQRLLKSQE